MGVVKTATHLLLPLLPLLGTAQALGPPGSHKAKPGRGRQESALSPSLLIRVGLLKTQPCNGEAFPQVLPPSLTPAASTGKRCGGTDATLPPTHPGRAWHCAGHTAGGGDKTRPRLRRRRRQGSGFFASLQWEVFSPSALFFSAK